VRTVGTPRCSCRHRRVDPSRSASAASKGKAAPDYTKFLDANGLKGARIGIVRAKMFGSSPEADQRRERGDRGVKAQGAVIIDPGRHPALGEYDDPTRRSSGAQVDSRLPEGMQPASGEGHLDQLDRVNKEQPAAKLQ